MLDNDFKEYISVVTNIMTNTNNKELCTKLLKVIVITSSIQNVLKNATSDNCFYSECIVILLRSDCNIVNIKLLELMFKHRNLIAHANNLVKTMKVFNEISMKDIDAEFSTIINVVETFEPFNAYSVVNTSNSEELKEIATDSDPLLLSARAIEKIYSFIPPKIKEMFSNKKDTVIYFLEL